MAKKKNVKEEVEKTEVAETGTETGAEKPEGVEVLDAADKPPRVVTRYGVEYDGNAYTSPRKALDAAGLTEVKGSRLRARFKKAGNTVGTEVEYEGKKFKYIEVPASADSSEDADGDTGDVDQD